MSISTDAIICFGVELEDDQLNETDDVEDWFGENLNPNLVELVTHCYMDEPMYIAAVKGTYMNAWRGSPKSFDTQEMSKYITQEALDELRKISDRDPKWLLCSYWG